MSSGTLRKHPAMPRRRYRRVSDEDRDGLITRYEAGEDFLDTAAEIRIPRTTAYEIICKFVETVERRKLLGGGGRRPPVSRALDGELITLKQVHNVPADRNLEDVKAARVALTQYMCEDGIHQHRVYVDATGYNLYTCKTYGRAPRGQRVNRIVAGQRGSNLKLIAAIYNLASLFYYEIHVTSVTKEVLKNFMTSLEPVLGSEATVISMDNAPCHAGIEQEFEDRVIKKLPPQSPFLNPIENCFSIL
ncbi:putative DDE superfamily endonuclease domain-containing protein 2 [Homarus americanus]|uniref:Putative DDE superfamily endonuclease domain-containing protein 2 n=1 Tax=Homarus americanus TaxID=6706 RepID=A0A8J5N472_HOMAM|nr:putative DDE superfamily endonuclease domain-containing protein 2 [Homarus americanus]